MSVIKTIGEVIGITDNRRATKVFGAVNKKMTGRGKQKYDLWIFFDIMGFTQKKISEYNYVYLLELYAKTTWVWLKIEKNSKFEFKI